MPVVYTTPPAPDQGQPRPPRARRRQLRREASWTTAQELDQLSREGLQAFSAELGLRRLEELLEEEADEVAGAARGVHSRHRVGHRHGTTSGYVVLGGQQVSICRPRVRRLDGGGEMELPSYHAAQDPRWLEEAILMATLHGVSQRSYRTVTESLNRLPAACSSGGISKSAVGRRFIAGSQQLVEQLLGRSLQGTRYLVLYLDGVEEGGHHVIVAMGMNEAGEKRILGLWEGHTESAAVCRELLEDLQARGLCIEQGLLVVIDGGKGLAAAIQEVWGQRVLVQRCIVHKKRNVIEQLPERERPWVSRQLEAAWANPDAEQAEQALQHLANLLQEQDQEQAAASLREGMRQTLTCHKLGVEPGLRASLTNTNPLESAFSRHTAVAQRVTRWRHGAQVLRWVAAGLLDAEERFQCLKTPVALQHLGERLERWAQHQRAAATTVA